MRIVFRGTCRFFISRFCFSVFYRCVQSPRYAVLRAKVLIWFPPHAEGRARILKYVFLHRTCYEYYSALKVFSAFFRRSFHLPPLLLPFPPPPPATRSTAWAFSSYICFACASSTLLPRPLPQYIIILCFGRARNMCGAETKETSSLQPKTEK